MPPVGALVPVTPGPSLNLYETSDRMFVRGTVSRTGAILCYLVSLFTVLLDISC